MGSFIYFVTFIAIIVIVIKKFGEIFIANISVVANFPSRQTLKPRYSYTRKKHFMTYVEHEFYMKLKNAFDEAYLVLPQVYIANLLDHEIRGQDWRAARAHIDRKSVDYVLFDKDCTRAIAAIELNDWTHDRQDRKERDEEVNRIFEAVGIPLFTFSNYEVSLEEIKNKINIHD